jgi:hypothetical protein
MGRVACFGAVVASSVGEGDGERGASGLWMLMLGAERCEPSRDMGWDE